MKTRHQSSKPHSQNLEKYLIVHRKINKDCFANQLRCARDDETFGSQNTISSALAHGSNVFHARQQLMKPFEERECHVFTNCRNHFH